MGMCYSPRGELVVGPRLWECRITLSTGWIAIRWIAQCILWTVFRWIAIYPSYSVKDSALCTTGPRSFEITWFKVLKIPLFWTPIYRCSPTTIQVCKKILTDKQRRWIKFTHLALQYTGKGTFRYRASIRVHSWYIWIKSFSHTKHGSVRVTSLR